MRPVKVLRWLLPDLALVAACVTLVYCLFLFQGYWKLFRDSDAGWHIRAGEAILSTGDLPRTDPYSFTRAGQLWFAWEWMADIAAGTVDRAAGLSGIALFYAAAIAAGVWLWFRLQWALEGDFLLACAMASLLLSTCNIHWLARPHVIGWLFLLAALLYAERARPPFRFRHAVEIAIFTALWANIHASFFFAPLIALIYAAGCAIRRRGARWFLWAAVVSALAPLANSYGWHLYAHVFRYLTDSDLLSRIGEFQSFDFHAGGTLAMLIAAMALRSARALPLVALLLLPLANAAITGTLRRAALLRTPAIQAATGFPPDQFPVEAYSQVARLPANARLFAPAGASTGSLSTSPTRSSPTITRSSQPWNSLAGKWSITIKPLPCSPGAERLVRCHARITFPA